MEFFIPIFFKSRKPKKSPFFLLDFFHPYLGEKNRQKLFFHFSNISKISKFYKRNAKTVWKIGKFRARLWEFWWKKFILSRFKKCSGLCNKYFYLFTLKFGQSNWFEWKFSLKFYSTCFIQKKFKPSFSKHLGSWSSRKSFGE